MNDLNDVIEEVRLAASEFPPDDMMHDELQFLIELKDTRARLADEEKACAENALLVLEQNDRANAAEARLAHEQATNANLLRALAEVNDLNVVRRTAMVNLHEHIEGLQARLAEAERAIESAGRCLVLSNNGPREAMEILRRYKATADSASLSSALGQGVGGGFRSAALEGVARAEVVVTPGTPGGGAPEQETEGHG